MYNARILQAARLKGRPTEEALVAAAGLPSAAAHRAIAAQIAAGALEHTGARLKLTAAGRALLDELLATERAGVDVERLRRLHDEFDDIDSAFAQLVTDWQHIDGIRPNDHSDTAYDQRIIERLNEIHTRFVPLLHRFVELAPRLEPYPDRFAEAVAMVRAGEHKWFALPLIDSYHTVWFELHEDIIGLTGLSRVEEANVR